MNYCADCPLHTLDSTMWDMCTGIEGTCYFDGGTSS